MGLGKTLQALALAANFRGDWPAIAIVPSSLKDQWNIQIRKWCSNLFEDIDEQLQIINSGSDVVKKNIKFLLCSYEMASKVDAKTVNFQLAILDESHYLNDLKSKRSRTILPFIKKMKRIICLTGTPALNAPVELYVHFLMLYPTKISLNEFADRYSIRKYNKFSRRIEYSDIRLEKELYFLLSYTFMIRRKKLNVLQELPDKIREPIFIDILEEESLPIQTKLKQLQGNILSNVESKLLINELFKLTGSAKVKILKSYIENIMHKAHKCVIFAHHIEVLKKIKEIIENLRYNYIYIDGSIAISSRKKYIDQFVKGDASVAILSVLACGTGLEFSVADSVVFAELYWVPGVLLQAEDRVHRIGSNHKTIKVYYMIAKNTIDIIVWKKLNKKWKSLSSGLNGLTETFVNS
uniref:DNA annealing helicase and endonuclease ZRANB3-like n=1 Tax=Dermatophagoides pteronyssinus TaxID=6956 RepID=A0A6P6XP37_DERPT|nr:DNA annealing helicase and endonuclease ZRANB3-like [Dermatophagoides pteronyssinus]